MVQNVDERFDALVDSEKKAQLLRSTDKVRKCMYRLKSDKEELMKRLPDKTPSDAQRKSINAAMNQLL